VNSFQEATLHVPCDLNDVTTPKFSLSKINENWGKKWGNLGIHREIRSKLTKSRKYRMT
jgi:hypothetical protein